MLAEVAMECTLYGGLFCQDRTDNVALYGAPFRETNVLVSNSASVSYLYYALAHYLIS